MSPVDRRRPRRLVDRLVAATLIAGVAAALLGAFLLQGSSRSATLADARERTRVLAEQYAVRFDDRVDGLVQDLEIAATRREIGRLEGGLAETELRVVLRASEAFDELALLDTEGRPRAAAASRFLADVTTLPADAALASQVARRGAQVELESDARPALRVAVPVEEPPGRMVGVLVAHAPLDLVGTVLEEAVAPRQPVPLLVDDAGRVLLHRDRDRVVAAEDYPLEEVLRSARGATSVEVSGERRIAAAVPSTRLDAAVVAEQPQSEALAPVDERRRDLVLILSVTLLATIFAVIVAGEILLRPLRPLTAAVARVGRGDLGVRTGVTAHGEIGQLALEVDRMSEALDERDEQLAELRQLSLLVGSIAERSAVVPRILSGAVRLVRAEGAALLPADPTSLDAPVVAGAVPTTPDLDEVVRAARRTGGPVTRSSSGAHLLGVPLASAEDAPLGTLVATRSTEPFGERDGELLSAFAAFASVAIDNAKRLELQRSLADQLQETVDRRRDVIGTVTHEFRTPLACIEGFASSLVDGWHDYGDDERLELVGRIAHHAEEMEELVARFLDYSVTERGGVVAHLEALSLRPVVDQVLEALAPLLAERALTVEVPELVVHADSTLLRRTLTNLLSNAVKYSPQGTPVSIAAESDGTRVRIDVTDEGRGMSTNEAAQAFEPFWRGGESSTRSARGTGLGLALVAEYTRAMEGACGVTSEVGRGSTFFITLRVASVEPADGDEQAVAT